MPVKAFRNHSNRSFTLKSQSVFSLFFSEHSVAAKTGGCFHGDAQVILEGGTTKPMHDLRPGERVLASSSSEGGGPLVYSPVLSFLDRQPNVTSLFYTIGTDAGHRITLTAAHLIYVADCMWSHAQPYLDSELEVRPSRDRGLRIVFASDVQPGQCVLTSGGKVGSQVTFSPVTFVQARGSTGLYAPLTEHGSIVVNGVLASCYAAVDSHHLAHWALAPLRFFYTLTGPWGSQADGLHWYPRLLQRLGTTLLDTEHFHPWGMDQGQR